MAGTSTTVPRPTKRSNRGRARSVALVPGSALAELRHGELSALDSCPDLCECGLACGGCVVRKRRESAVVGRSELVERDVLRCLEDAVAHLLGRLDLGVDRVDHPDEDPLARLEVGTERLEHRRPVVLARELEVEASCSETQEAGQESGVVDVCAVSRIVVSAGAAVHADPMTFLGGEA